MASQVNSARRADWNRGSSANRLLAVPWLSTAHDYWVLSPKMKHGSNRNPPKIPGVTTSLLVQALTIPSCSLLAQVICTSKFSASQKGL